MSETPAPYGPQFKKSDLEKIAHFLNGYFGPEILEGIEYPEKLQGDFEDLGDEEQKEWFEITFHDILREAAYQIVGLLARQLSPVELNLIKRRILDYMKAQGFFYDK